MGFASQWSLTFEVRKRLEFHYEGFDAIRSQWSLTFEVRKRSVLPSTYQLGGSLSQWSLTFEVRKRSSYFLESASTFSLSQWSLTFEVRKSGWRTSRDADSGRVAMEPDL